MSGVIGRSFLLMLLFLCASCTADSGPKGTAPDIKMMNKSAGNSLPPVAGKKADTAIADIVSFAMRAEISERDKKYLSTNINKGLDTAYRNTYYKYTNPITGTNGEIVLVSTLTNKQQVCGNFAEYININNLKYKVSYRACRHNSGKWYIVKHI